MGTEAEPEYAAYAEARGALVDAMQRAIAASRTETRQATSRSATARARSSSTRC